LDSYLDHITTQARLTEQLKQLLAGTDEEEEGEAQVVDEHVKQEVDACVPRTTKTKKKVSSIRVHLHSTDNLQGPFRDRDL
jgi:hypothetical protein